MLPMSRKQQILELANKDKSVPNAIEDGIGQCCPEQGLLLIE